MHPLQKEYESMNIERQYLGNNNLFASFNIHN